MSFIKVGSVYNSMKKTFLKYLLRKIELWSDLSMISKEGLGKKLSLIIDQYGHSPR